MKKIIIPLTIIITMFIVSCFIVLGAIDRTLWFNREEQREQLEKSITKGIVECYALEGIYPPDISYLRQYGVVVNEEQFIVHYEIFADNIMPNFIVIDKK